MTSGKKILLIAVVIILVLAGSLYSFFKGTYNQFVTLDESVKVILGAGGKPAPAAL